MTKNTYEELKQIVGLLLQNQNTNMRESVSPEERILITLSLFLPYFAFTVDYPYFVHIRGVNESTLTRQVMNVGSFHNLLLMLGLQVMANSIVKVTEHQGNDSLLLVIAEDGTVSPDRQTVETYLNDRRGATELQVMHVNKSDGQNIDITLDTLMYVHSEEVIENEEPAEMDELQRNLMSFRMDHDYTPLTSPKRQSPVPHGAEVIDELAQTLSILEGTAEEPVKPKPKQPLKIKRVVSVVTNKQKARMITTAQTPLIINKQPRQAMVVNKVVKVVKPAVQQEVEDEEETDSDEDYDDMDYDDDDNDSDFELEEKPRLTKKAVPKRTRRLAETVPRFTVKRISKINQQIKEPPIKLEQEAPKTGKVVEKEPEPKPELKQPDKKLPKKEKKAPKPPDDFALFSTPDIIRRVGMKEPQTPTTPTTPDIPKMVKPAKITIENRSKSNENKAVKRPSVDQKRLSMDDKSRRTSADKPVKKMDKTPEKRAEGQVSVQGYDESLGSNSSESMLESQLEPLPSAEDIRAIIQNENTKSFTTSLVIPEPPEMDTNDQNQLESGSLELDQSILDNINPDLISEDILYQVAQSLAENPDLQNVIDKSIVDGNLILDPSLQSMNEEQSLQQSQSNNMQLVASSYGENSATATIRGTQIIRADGRVVVLPPIERPATRSRNRRGMESMEVRQVARKQLDEEQISGNELDSSGDEEEESEDDPNKLWCICNQPHNNRFMICCDTCEEWYHGKCVNVTKAMGQMMEQEGKEWICVYCKDHSLKRPSAAARRIRKASRTSRTSTDSASSQQRNKPTSSVPAEAPKTPGCIVCGKPSRNSSIYCSDGCILKHAQGVEKVVVFDRRTGRTLSGSGAPTAANLEKWLKEHPGFEVARPRPKKMAQSKLQLIKNSANEGISLAVSRKGVNIGVLQHTPKIDPQSVKVKTITGIKILNKHAPTTPQKMVKLIQPVPITRPQTTSVTSTTPTKPPKLLNSAVVKQPTTPTMKEKVVVMKTPKARQAEVGTPTQQPKQENIRDNVRKTLMEQLTNRLKMIEDLKLTPDEVTNISNEIESQLFKCFGDTGQKYRTKYRSLIFNIKDIKNQTLWRRICEKSINPYQLVRLSHDDLASQELAMWRQREAKHQLDMIEKSELELLNCNRQYVFKTHKGEQVFEDDRPKDQTVTEVITALNATNTSEKEEPKKETSKEKDKKGSSSSLSSSKKRDKSKDRKSSKEKSDSKERRKDHRSSSRDREKERSRDKDREKERDKKRRSRSRDRSRHSEKRRSRSRDRERHRKGSHKSSRHKKEATGDTKLDKKSKEILEQLVDKQIVPPLEDRLWKHVPQEDVAAGNAESDSDHEPSSTVTIPTPPRNTESDEPQSTVPPVEPEKPIRDVITFVEKKEVPKPALPETIIESISPKVESIEISTRPLSENVWTGTINMVDVAQISITAHEVSGDCHGLNEELPGSLDIVGRISPDTVWDYISKMKCSNSKMISLLRLNATNMEEKMPYIALYSYLSSRNRLGVVKTVNKAVKDFYILPLGSSVPIPQALLPINGPGFEDSRPPLLVGIIVRDKRKRPMLDAITNAVLNKRAKVDSVTSSPAQARSVTPPIPATTPARSYTPPPNRDPRIKPSYTTISSLPTPPTASTADEDEPYSPEDSDPEVTTPPLPSVETTSKVSSSLLNPPAKSTASFLSTQPFKPFSNKFDDIPGLDLEDSSALPASTQELQRKMAELDQRIAMQQAEIHNMSQDIVSSASVSGSDIGTSALANIALPNNLQQILESIKIIGAQTRTDTDPPVSKITTPPQQDLTIPLMLPKISSRSASAAGASNQKVEASSSTIPLNLPKIKSKHSATNSPQRSTEVDRGTSSVLSSLSEEDLIRKAAEMLGETGASSKKQKRVELEKDIPLPLSYTPTPNLFPQPPPPIVPPPPTQSMSPLPSKRSKIDMNQPPIPGLEDEC